MIGSGKPVMDGLYAAHVHFGWKLLEFHDGAWWHCAKVGRWMADDPKFHVGPLPDMKPKQEFDL